jgi:hypothetical protein
MEQEVLTKKGIDEMNLKQLKDCCKDRGLKVGGTKEELKRILLFSFWLIFIPTGRICTRLTAEEKKNELKRKEDQLVERYSDNYSLL